MSQIRRVVSGQTKDGKSHIVEDGVVIGVEVSPGAHIFPIWGADEAPRFPQSGVPPKFESFFPESGGYRFIVISIPPGDGQSPSKSEYVELSTDAESSLGANLHGALEDDAPGMHTTDTVDLEVVLEGEAGLEFDDGEQVFLKTGDFFIQNGTRHRWFNRGSSPARVACVVIGGHPR